MVVINCVTNVSRKNVNNNMSIYSNLLTYCKFTPILHLFNTLDYALNKKWIVKGSLDASDFIQNVDMIIICLYPKLILKFLKQYSYFVPNSFVDFVNSMSKTSDGRSYNMSLHSKLRIIERKKM